jgi:hypothetical protein
MNDIKNELSSIEFFYSIPDDLLVEIALKDWESLEKLCNALSLDLQLLKENQKTPVTGKIC